MKPFIFNQLSRRFRNAHLAICASALLAMGSTATAVVVDGVFDPNEGYAHVDYTFFQVQNGTVLPNPGILAWNQDAQGNVYVAFVIPLSIGDNSYGTNSIGWGNHEHKFSNLTGSDKAHFDFYNGAGQAVLAFNLDYITSVRDVPGKNSDYASLGVNGGDGKITGETGLKGLSGGGGKGIGQASWILSWGTSLDYNLNNVAGNGASTAPGRGHSSFTTNSPFTTPQLNPDGTINYGLPYNDPASAPGWNYYISYEVMISAAAFGASGFGHVSVPAAHVSPSKVGQNTVPMIPEPATYLGGFAAFTFALLFYAQQARKRRPSKL